MDDEAARPQLDTGVYQSIELEQYEIHKRYLASLKELQVLPASDAGEAIWPRDPGRVSRMIEQYGKALFDAEAKRYPQSDNRNAWLRSLAERIETMMSRRIWDQDTVSAAKLTYHGSREEIDALTRNALQTYVDEQIAPPPLPPAPQFEVVDTTALRSLAVAAGHSSFSARQTPGNGSNGQSAKLRSPDVIEENKRVARQIRGLRREARLTVEELAGRVGIASRSVQRHESGEVTDIRLRHVRAYERVFTSLLKRPVRIDNAPYEHRR